MNALDAISRSWSYRWRSRCWSRQRKPKSRHLRAASPIYRSKRGEPRQDILQALHGEAPLHTVIDDWLIGTPEAVAEQVATYQSLGISHFMLWFLDFPSLEGLSLFASHVRPALRASV